MTVTPIARAVKATLKKPAREVSQHGIAFIEHAEGAPGTGAPVLTAYQDSAGVWTIGWGHTQGVTEGMTCTVEQAVAWLDVDLDDAEHAVCTFVTVPLNDNQFDALVSFVFNIGTEGFMTSTLLRRLNTGEYDAVPEEMARWNKVTVKGVKKVSAGLVNRRASEAALFVLPVPKPAETPAPAPQTAPESAVAPVQAAPAVPKPPLPVMANEVPTPPPTKVSHTPGGKTGITALLAGAGGLMSEGYQQAQPTLAALHNITDGIGRGPQWLRLIGAALVLVSIGALTFSLWRQRMKLRSGQ